MTSENYITQHFLPRPSHKGAKENSDAYNTRIYWFKNGFPKYEEVANAFNFKKGRIDNYANKYNWKLIRQNYEELKEKEDLEQYKADAKRMEKKQNTANELMFNYNVRRMEQLLYILNELPNKPAQKKLTKEEEEKSRKELREIMADLRELQPKIRTSYHLTNNYTDKQITENVTTINGELNLEHTATKSFEEEMKEYEDYFEQIDSKGQSAANKNSTQK